MLKTLINSHSQERFTDYYKIAKSPIDTNILKLYFLNQKISCYFYFIIQNLEVSLRNKINLIISTHYTNQKHPNHWFSINTKSKTINIFNYGILKGNNKIENNIYETIINIHQFKKIPITAITADMLISNLTLGTWVAIISDNPILFESIFINNPYINIYLQNIRILRNKISHTGNIIKKKNNPKVYYNYIATIFNFLCKDSFKIVKNQINTILNTDIKKLQQELQELHK
jgi:hypothetical protein